MNRSSRSLRWLHRTQSPHWGKTPEGLDLERIQRARRWLERFFGEHGRFPVSHSGLAEVPDGPTMFVSNHSGGSTVLDCLGLGYAWYSHFRERPLHFLAHEILLATRLTGPFFHQCGVLRTSRGIALEVLDQWKRDVVVMPGGDRDTWRPWRDRYRVQFAGHTGYARVALKAGVPIVPVAHVGPHDTLMVLSDGRRIADRLGMHDLFRIDVFPIHLSVPWGLGVGPWPHMPLPTALRYRFGAPVLPPERVPPGTEPREALVREYDRRVQAAMQELLDRFADEAPPPRRLRGWLRRWAACPWGEASPPTPEIAAPFGGDYLCAAE